MRRASKDVYVQKNSRRSRRSRPSPWVWRPAAAAAVRPTTSTTPPPTTPDTTPPAQPVTVTVTDSTYLDADNMPVAGTTTIAAGATHTSGGVTFLCAEGGEDCVVTVADDGSVEATGGMVTASLTAAAMMQVAEAKEMRGRGRRSPLGWSV